jgi:hypothetical protein
LSGYGILPADQHAAHMLLTELDVPHLHADGPRRDHH